jgi:hypothetical protein
MSHAISEDRRQLDPKRTRNLLLCLDGIRYAAGICIGCHSRALKQLQSFEHCNELAVPTGEALLALADVWSMVDAAYRIRTLLSRSTVLPKKDPAARLFMQRTADVEILRHYVQHLDGEVGTLPEGSPPLWGTVSWTKSDDPSTYFTLMTGDVRLRPSYQGLVYDRQEHRFVRSFELHAAGTSIDLDLLVRHVTIFDQIVSLWTTRLIFADGSKYEYSQTLSPLIHVSFRCLEAKRGCP